MLIDSEAGDKLVDQMEEQILNFDSSNLLQSALVYYCMYNNTWVTDDILCKLFQSFLCKPTCQNVKSLRILATETQFSNIIFQ